MQIDRLLDDKRKIDLSLRLWSDQTSIATLLERSSLEAEHCHCFGETIVIGGRSTNRVARRSYVSLQNFETRDVEGLSNWLADTQKRLDSSDEISSGLKSGQIEGVIWIALFGGGMQPIPHIDAKIITNCLERRVRILVENYTDIDVEGLPRKTWLTT